MVFRYFGVVNPNNDLNSIVSKNKLGNLINDLNVYNLEKAIQYFDLSESEYSDLQRRCKSFFKKNYTTDKVTQSILKRFNKTT